MIHYDAQSQSIFLQNFPRESGAKWFKGVPFAVYPLFAFFPNFLYWFAVEISTFALEQLLNILVPLRYWLSEVCHVRSTFLLLLRATLAKYIQTTLNLGSHLLGIPPGLLETKRCSHCRHFKTFGNISTIGTSLILLRMLASKSPNVYIYIYINIQRHISNRINLCENTIAHMLLRLSKLDHMFQYLQKLHLSKKISALYKLNDTVRKQMEYIY